MREQLLARSGGENCIVFSDERRREVRVVYEPDGRPLYCASDIAACMGYAAPYKLVARAGICPQYRRFVPWVSKTRRGHSEAICLDADGVREFVDRLALSDEVQEWVNEKVIPEAEAIGAQRGYEYESPEDEPLPRDGPPRGILERLDNIILEAAMLKREIMKIT